MNKKTKLSGIGSEFHWSGLPEGPFLPWPIPHLFLALGRDAVCALWGMKKNKFSRGVLFVPDYFCPDVCKFWKDSGIKIRRYEDDPRWPHPNWHTLTPARGDCVLAVNYFGVRDGSVWKDWLKGNPRISLVEDHSHDPFSSWAKNSIADFCFASIRKIFPVPDGAILWSPRRHPMPPELENRDCSGSALKLAGMILKKEYGDTKGTSLLLKDTFRKFQVEGEKLLSESKGLNISPWSRYLLLNGIPQSWRIQRKKNVRLLLELLQENADFRPLFLDWPLGHCPFNVILVFKTNRYREIFRSRLISKAVFTPIHWKIDSGKGTHVFDLSSRILTIPVDHRYSSSDLYFIADNIKEISDGI
ncbi:MAG: hypothetical protein PHC33_03940 [Candidatus Omnitrophica bacterium]|nr:hypothetical protein [Candidatus Omnitrophota bacterium]